MPSMYNGAALFESGPHRFQVDRQGLTELPPGERYSPQTAPSPVWVPLGLVQLTVIVRGRLVAASEAGLWALRDAITSELSSQPVAAMLQDGSGRSWADMWLVRYLETGPVAVGRTWSVGYEAVFREVV